ncbi:MAG TPA: TonB-dependent receptor plug domain-containing protein, partial [Gemmatimonadaceae bacterium]|nr:TonB-dependent receptor plug domain-containing protein [Gemmatimonadaceae bacterium]
MKRFAYSIFLMLAPVVLSAQVTIRGTVVDQQTGGPVAGAIITVTGTTTAAAASDSGRFALTSASNVTSITVTRVGYTPKVVAISSPGETLRIELAVSTAELPGVQIVATNPAPSTAVLTQSDLNRASGLNLIDAINTIPGVFMQTRTPFGGAHINIRGYYPSVSGNSPNSNGEGYAVFLNNIPITDATGATVMDDIDFSTLGKVQVIKGPASSLYGGFIGGTLNLTTARPTPDQASVEQQVLGGGDGIVRTNTMLQGASENSDYVINYGFQNDTSWRRHSQSQKTYVRASGDFSIATNHTVSAYFSYNRSLEDLAGEIDSTDFYARRPVSDSFYVSNNSHIQITSWFTGVTDTYRINDHFSNQTTVFGGSRFTDQPIAHGYTDATQLNGGGRTQFTFTGSLGAAGVTGTLGGMLQRSNITSDGASIGHAAPYAETPSASENFAQNGYAFTEWTFDFPSQITLTGGGAMTYDVWQVHNLLVNKQIVDTIPASQWLTKHFTPTFAPRLALTKGLGTLGSVYASWSTGFTPPLLSSITASNGTVDTSLKPERATQYEVGVQGTLFSRLGGQLSLFDIDNTNKLIQQSVAGVTSTTNVGEQRNTGAEVSLSYLAVSDSSSMLSTLRPWASYTYTNATYVSYFSDDNNTAATVNFSGNQAARIPRIMYSGGIDASSTTGFYGNSTYNFVGRVPVTFDNSTWVHSYDLLGAKVGYRTTIQHRWILNAFVGGDNLTNQTYYTFV